MGISDRIKGSIDQWADEWKDRLRGWMASWVVKGIETTFDFFEPDLRAEIKPSLERLKTIEGLPEDFRILIDKTLEEPKAIHLVAILPYLIGIMIGFGMGSARPVMNVSSYLVEKLVHSFRLDPASVITAWRRDPAAYEKYFDDLKDLGWTDDRIEALKFLTLFIPTADEQTLWLAREVYEPEMIDRYGLDDELPKYEETDFAKIGVSPEQMTNKWRAHWEHASWIQVIEMLRRGILTLDKRVVEPPTTKEGWEARDAEGIKALYDWYRVVEITPFWRDKLTAMSWSVPTRVDVRRFWDMRTIDEARLRSVYHAQGYHGEDLEDYILWTKVYTAFPDLVARWTKGWITEDDVRSELIALGMPADRVEEMIQTKIEAVKGERTAGEKSLTMALIVEGVKKGVITKTEGIERLVEIGYDESEADYILTVRIETLTGSPETVVDFMDITQKWRKAVGKEAKPVTEELKKAAAEVVRLTKEVESLREAVEAEQKTLIDEEILPKAATAKRDKLRVTLHRAEAELHRVQTDYNALLAEWRHKEAV